MGVKFTCDCGKEKIGEPEDFEKVGAEGKLYCKGECTDRVKEFLEKRDKLHDDVVQFWNDGLALLKADYEDFEVPGGP